MPYIITVVFVVNRSASPVEDDEVNENIDNSVSAAEYNNAQMDGYADSKEEADERLPNVSLVLGGTSR